MMVTSGAELDVLRERLSADQRAVLNAIWDHYLAHNQWVPRRLLHQRFGKTAALSILQQLGENIICEARDDGKDHYRLTFLGVLLTDQGGESEGLLVRYLEYVRDRCKTNPSLEWVGSQEVEAALGLTAHRSRLLRQLIRLSHWWGGGSGFGDQEWTVGVPVDVDDLFPESDLRSYVREHILTHFPPGAPSRNAEKPRGEFWFIRDPDLQRQLAANWREAQDVYQVRCWKSCVILCGGILEAVLLEALAREASACGGEVISAETSQRDLGDLVNAARRLGVLGTGLPHLGQALRAFPRLIHPGFPTGEKVEVTREDAEAALIAVRMCLRQIAASRGG